MAPTYKEYAGDGDGPNDPRVHPGVLDGADANAADAQLVALQAVDGGRTGTGDRGAVGRLREQEERHRRLSWN